MQPCPSDPPCCGRQDRGLTLGKIKSLAHARCIKADISALSSAGIFESRSFAQLHDRSTHHALRTFLHFYDFRRCDTVTTLPTTWSSACDNAEGSFDLKLRFYR